MVEMWFHTKPQHQRRRIKEKKGKRNTKEEKEKIL